MNGFGFRVRAGQPGVTSLRGRIRFAWNHEIGAAHHPGARLTAGARAAGDAV
jgi:hypothetical protein